MVGKLHSRELLHEVVDRVYGGRKDGLPCYLGQIMAEEDTTSPIGEDESCSLQVFAVIFIESVGYAV